MRVALIAILSLLSLASCTTVDRDPEYQTLAASAESNPKPDAIVGMWHRKVDDWDGTRWRLSLLVRRDGRGSVDSFLDGDWGEGTEVDRMGDFLWTYRGQGVWELRSISRPGKVDECRVSGGRLLRHSKNFILGPGYLVYARVDP